MTYICKHCGCENEIENKSNPQNNYLHLLFSKIADKSGYTPGQIKILMKQEFNLYEDFTNKKTGETFRRYISVAELTKKEMAKFIDDVYHFANVHGVNVQSPEEYYLFTNFKLTSVKIK